MDFRPETFGSVKELAREINRILNSFLQKHKNNPLKRELSGEDLKMLLGKMLDNDTNRARAFPDGSLSRTIRTKAFVSTKNGEKKKKLFVDSLLAYNEKTYSELLADLIN
ncbi:MAG: hypothetical protein LBK66_01295 [Spirochaetaceae bacterium]|jgi:hypothetical protein|nr:hypothetical protein [Spirochaetaceae bacterium]